jgi:hypothetical protein
MKEYGYYVNGDGIICVECADNPLYQGELTIADAEGYPDGYTCLDCGTTIDGRK